MALTVIVRSGETSTPKSITFDAPRVVLGRGEGCEVRLPDASVSQRHASIRQRGTDYIIVDEGSTNGTFVGPVRLSPHAPRLLRSGELIRLGRIWLEVRVEQALATVNPHVATKELALALVAGAMAAQGESAAVRVSVLSGPDSGRELLLEDFDRPYVLGRGGKIDLDLKDEDASRRHVELVRRGDQLLVRDLGSKNGTLLGDKKVPENKGMPWPRGATLTVAGNVFVHHDPLADALRDLERAADERMSAEESVDPPRVDSAEPSAPPSIAAPEPGPAAPVAVVPARSRPVRRVKRSWNTTDLLVGALALAVLVLSLLGLVWLFRLE